MLGWSEIPYDVLVIIANKLRDVADFLSFSLVCRHWNTVYLKKEWNCSRTTPWLMLNDRDVSRRKLLSFSSFKCYSLPFQEPYNCRYWGTSQGWIAMFSEDFVLRLFNPVTRVCISLPSLRNVIRTIYNSRWFSAVEKAVVSKLHDEIVTMIISEDSRNLLLCRHGDNYWATVKFPTIVSLSDVLCFNNQILAVTMTGVLMLIDTNLPDGPKAHFAASPPKGERGWSNLYLTGSQNRLLLVFHYRGKVFRVYELDVSKGKWSEVDDLGGHALLVDDYNCTSVCADGGFFKNNCIYHVGDNSLTDYVNRQTWLTVYNVKDGTSADSLICNHSVIYSCPLWMKPTIW